MENYTKLVSTLSSVRKTKPRAGIVESHRAACPVCDGHGLPLSVALSETHLTLIHCFGGCDPITIANHCGLDIADLMPPSSTSHNSYKKEFAGPRDWMSAVALADAISQYSYLLMVALRLDSEHEDAACVLMDMCEGFKAAATRAMRSNRGAK